ncbi:MAG: quinone-dependent dihydroorotate dehydrogenase [Burkholderiaceae bacterium]
MPSLYAPLKSLLFKLDPETSHDLTLKACRLPGAAALIRLAAGPRIDDPVSILGLNFTNRVGLAAGLDKNARYLDALSQAGFGFLEAGTVTPKAQPGNAKPRMFRLPEQHAVINRFGFNNLGLDDFTRNVRDAHFQGVLGLNIGKNATTPIEQATQDYLTGLERCFPLASYITVNISSPNTSDLRALQHDQALTDMLSSLADARLQLAQQHGRQVPMLIKIAPDLSTDQIDQIAGQLVSHQMDGVIATNTTISRQGVEQAAHSGEGGGLSGAPLLARSNEVIARLRKVLPAGFPIIGVGGIRHERDALEKLEAGADLLQLYTGLVYEGPALVGRCARVAQDFFARRRQNPVGTG